MSTVETNEFANDIHHGNKAVLTYRSVVVIDLMPLKHFIMLIIGDSKTVCYMNHLPLKKNPTPI